MARSSYVQTREQGRLNPELRFTGADEFNYTTTHNSEGGDYINDFKANGDADTFKFSSAGGYVWSGTPFATSSDYNGSTGTGLSAGVQQFIYDSTDRQLWYDADGVGAGAGVLIATLTDSSEAVVQADISVV